MINERLMEHLITHLQNLKKETGMKVEIAIISFPENNTQFNVFWSELIQDYKCEKQLYGEKDELSDG